MPAYPFVQMPTFGEFLRIAEQEFECSYTVEEFKVVGCDSFQSFGEK